MLCHPENGDFVKKNKKELLSEVFETKKGSVAVMHHDSIDLSSIHAFLNGEYIGFVLIQDESVHVPKDESKLPTNVN